MAVSVDFNAGMALSFAPPSRTEEIMQDIFVVLNTVKGEVPFYRDFGVDSEYLHKPIMTAKTMYAAAITEAVEKFVPAVRVKQVRFADDAANPATLVPILEVEINE